MRNIHCKLLIPAVLAAAITGLALRALAADSEGISITDKYISFLHFHSITVWRQTSEATNLNVVARAERLRIESVDMSILDQVALEFAKQEGLLREEARRYHATTQARGDIVDPAIVRSFSDRRKALASDAFRNLKTKFSPESYVGLHAFLEQDFSRSITRFSK